MEFAKATITPEKPAGEPIPVLFNPTQYTLLKSIQLAEAGVQGLRSPLLQFVRGNARTLSMSLFFDTYETKEDVRVHTNRIYGLMDIESETHVPAIVIFRWGQGRWGEHDANSFRCVIEQVSGQFGLFLEDGTPVRATLTVTFKEWIAPEMAVRDPKTASADHVKTRAVQRGDSVMSIAAAEYGDPARWRPIADANRLHNPRRLEPGQILVIPALDEQGRRR